MDREIKNEVVEKQYEDLKNGIKFRIENNITDDWEQHYHCIDVLCGEHKARIRDIENSICKIQDLEAKLAESEKSKEINIKERDKICLEMATDYNKQIFELKQQLEKKDGELHQIYSHLGVEAFGEDIHEQALKEIAKREKKLELRKSFCMACQSIDNQTAIAELEQLKHDIWTNQHDDGWLDEKVDIYELTEMIDQQIKSLKGEE